MPLKPAMDIERVTPRLNLHLVEPPVNIKANWGLSIFDSGFPNTTI
ncbi:hypothetical protein EMA8858_00347 [Emticicia aquatica]|uniref:Uncharacterized protein n=1 Tax=Emticicia aquatica TaxID=1681835 RepID=A0ABM9AKJ7_9BACT|nr:hypothetical protein [Emticicia aquatica]CAH0994238.1 hypothetical protein EMA8858_00347 [Emticicia aquatica]